MYITNYQMHNVLKVYTEQLSKNNASKQPKTEMRKPLKDNVSISAEARRQSVIDKVAADIVTRITRYGPHNEMERGIIDRLQEEITETRDSGSRKTTRFKYNIIDGKKEKTTNTLMMEDPGYLIKRLEQLAKETVSKNMAS